MFLLPSEQESFGLAALEAMVHKVPVVCSDAGGLSEVVENSVSGFLCPVGDINGMAKITRIGRIGKLVKLTRLLRILKILKARSKLLKYA